MQIVLSPPLPFLWQQPLHHHQLTKENHQNSLLVVHINVYERLPAGRTVESSLLQKMGESTGRNVIR